MRRIVALLVSAAVLALTVAGSSEVEGFTVITPPTDPAAGAPSQWAVRLKGRPGVPPFNSKDIVYGINSNLVTGFGAACRPEIAAAVRTWQVRGPVAGGNLNPAGAVRCGVGGAAVFDLESLAVHEIGHSLGLDHPNLGAATGATADPKNLDPTRPNPFDVAGPCPALIQGPPFRPVDPVINSLVTPHRANAALLNVAGLPLYGVPANSEAVMIQGAVRGEVQRQLLHDDMAGIFWIERGADRKCGTGDDFRYGLGGPFVRFDPTACGAAAAPPAGIHVFISQCPLGGALGLAIPTFNRAGFASAKVFLDVATDGTVVGKADVYYGGMVSEVDDSGVMIGEVPASSDEISFVDIILDVAPAVGGTTEQLVNHMPSAVSGGGSGPSVPYAAIAGGAAAVLAVALGGGWYAWRVWLRKRAA
jgi:hypothetical protein